MLVLSRNYYSLWTYPPILVIFCEKLADQSNQCGTEHIGQLGEHYEQSKKSSDCQEQSPMEHDIHHVLNNEHQNVDKNTENSENKEVVLLKNLKYLITYSPICPGERVSLFVLLSYCLVATSLVLDSWWYYL